MVKGISRQVIVVESPDKKLFDQAIFILKEDALASGGVTDEALLREAGALIRNKNPRRSLMVLRGALWAAGGAVTTAVFWLLTAWL